MGKILSEIKFHHTDNEWKKFIENELILKIRLYFKNFYIHIKNFTESA